MFFFVPSHMRTEVCKRLIMQLLCFACDHSGLLLLWKFTPYSAALNFSMSTTHLLQFLVQTTSFFLSFAMNTVKFFWGGLFETLFCPWRCISPGFENYSLSYVKIEVFTIVALNITVILDVVLKSMVEIYWNFHHQCGWRQWVSWNVIKYLPPCGITCHKTVIFMQLRSIGHQWKGR